MSATHTIPATSAQVAPPIEQLVPGAKTRVAEGGLSGAINLRLGIGLVALIATVAAFFGGEELRKQAAFSYLVAYMFTLGIALGALFFVMIQHITRAGWSVTVRRLAENIAGLLWPWMPILFLPVAYVYHDLYHHWLDAEIVDAGAANFDGVLAGKSSYLNGTAFFVRAAIYFLVWAGLAMFFRRSSLGQDKTGDPAVTLRMSRLAAPGLLLYAITVTLASIDWIMSIDPHWYSTIFGICYFAGGVMAFLAVFGLTLMYLQRKGYLGEFVNTEHYHDIGKLMWAFVVFWAYVNFSQFMLIWYANIPEETLWYEHRQGWNSFFILLCVGHFLVPFVFLMSRHFKRNPKTLAICAVWLLIMHWVDMQYLIMPSGDFHGPHPHWLDLTAMIGVMGIFIGLVLRNVANTPLVPERDPRLAESMQFHNV